MSGDRFDPGRAAFDFLDDIERMTSRDEVMDRLDKELGRYGFHAWLVTGVPVRGERIDPLMILNGWPKGWTRLYTQQNFVQDDPVAAYCFRSRDPFEWVEAPYNRITNPRAHEVMNRATDFRMNRGFCVPIHSAEGYQAAVTMAGDCVDLVSRTKPALHLMALYSYAKATDLMKPGRKERVYLLSKREREVLSWAAAGKTTWEISQILAIGEQTVLTHLKAAATKFDAPNRVSTVVAALRRGEISL